jgi:hypothetical protein
LTRPHAERTIAGSTSAHADWTAPREAREPPVSVRRRRTFACRGALELGGTVASKGRDRRGFKAKNSDGKNESSTKIGAAPRPSAGAISNSVPPALRAHGARALSS